MTHARTLFLAIVAVAAAACGDPTTPELAATAGLSPADLVASTHAATVEYEFTFTGAPQTFVAPAGGTYLVEAWGAQGGGPDAAPGGYAAGSVQLTAGQTLHVFVGGRGEPGVRATRAGGAGGWNGGGAGGDLLATRNASGHGGGGASDIRMGGTGLADRVLVAGGGGGGFEGGAGGGLVGGDGAGGWCSLTNCAGDFEQHETTWYTSGHYANGGRGATQTAAGIGGTTANNFGFPGSDGAAGQGGRGGDAAVAGAGGGGGGGGYFGGGGGAGGGFWSGAPGRGGGGSGYVDASLFTGAELTAGVRSGHGLVVISAAGPLPVTIDIKPGSDTNPVNLRSGGVIPVAVFTTADFDATIIDPTTLAFGPDGAGEAHGRLHTEDVDGDGRPDAVAHFRTRDSGIACTDAEATLTGETTDGVAVIGTDALRTRGC